MCKNFTGEQKMAGKVKVGTWKAHELDPLCMPFEKWHEALTSDSPGFKSLLCHFLAGQSGASQITFL